MNDNDEYMVEDHQNELPDDLTRVQQAILLALYKNHPVPMTEEEINEFIVLEGLLDMTDAEFKEYREKLVRWKNG